MILKRIAVQNWRGLEAREVTFGSGINVVQGPNEAGKSSLVEALDWALYRDITGSRLPADEVRAIIPAGAPAAKPRVELEVEFSDCIALITKQLAVESARRECRLVVRREGAADLHFDRTEAQRQMRALFAADGLGEERGSVAEGGLLISHQGESLDFLGDGSTAIRSTLGVSADGELALTGRLEKVRASVETARGRELVRDLDARAVEGARAGTEAGRAREALVRASTTLEGWREKSRAIERLRDEIAEVDAGLTKLIPRQEHAAQASDALTARRLAQSEAEGERLAAENKLRLAETAHQIALRVQNEITELRRGQVADEQALEQNSGALEQAGEGLAMARAALDASQEALALAETDLEGANRMAAAWRAYGAVFEARDAASRQKRAVENLIALGNARDEARATVAGLSPVPSPQELRAWRDGYDGWLRLAAEAAQSLRLRVDVEERREFKVNVDGAGPETIAVLPLDPALVSGSGELVVDVPGFGRLTLTTGARGAREVRAEAERAAGALVAQLRPWGVELENFPSALESWETARAERDRLERGAQAAAAAMTTEEGKSGSLPMAEAALAELEDELEAAKAKSLAYEGCINIGGKTRPEVRTECERAETAAKEAGNRVIRARNEANTASERVRRAQEEWNRLDSGPAALRARLASRAEQLARLEGDGLDASARRARIEELGLELLRARHEFEDAKSRRAELGDAVTTWHFEEARREATALAAERNQLATHLAELRRDLYHHCEQDPVEEIARLESEVEVLERDVAGHEARLRGLALLEAVLQMERTRLGRALSGPLNQRISPWLSELRGKPTVLEFDDAGTKIRAVRTVEGEATIELPFDAHSEGMKEQVAFALRLILASRVAGHMPSGRLPVILDDPFTQTDASRRRGLGRVLAEVAENLQVLFVTCHPWQAVPGLEVNLILMGDLMPEVGSEPEVSKEVSAPRKPGRRPARTPDDTESNAAELATLSLF